MEVVLGANFADVRVHVGREAGAIGALAFTHGNDLYFAPGQYQPHTMQGMRLLGHELTHVLQQKARRVHNTTNDTTIVQDPILEAEADKGGWAVVRQGLSTQAGFQEKPCGNGRRKMNNIFRARSAQAVQKFCAVNYGKPKYNPDEIVDTVTYIRQSDSSRGHHFISDKIISSIITDIIKGRTRDKSVTILAELTQKILPVTKSFSVKQEFVYNSDHDYFLDKCIAAISKTEANMFSKKIKASERSEDFKGKNIDIPLKYDKVTKIKFTGEKLKQVLDLRKQLVNNALAFVGAIKHLRENGERGSSRAHFESETLEDLTTITMACDKIINEDALGLENIDIDSDLDNSLDSSIDTSLASPIKTTSYNNLTKDAATQYGE